MKKHFAVLALASTLALPISATAQDEARAYDNGPVWDITAVQTKAGHFDDYMRWLATKWKPAHEDLKRQGVVLDYKVLSVADPRDNEPDLFLMVEFKNMAAFDVSLDTLDASTKKSFGSMAAAAASELQRETIRTPRGDMLVRELILK